MNGLLGGGRSFELGAVVGLMRLENVVGDDLMMIT